jgi:hypothetical protein
MLLPEVLPIPWMVRPCPGFRLLDGHRELSELVTWGNRKNPTPGMEDFDGDIVAQCVAWEDD